MNSTHFLPVCLFACLCVANASCSSSRTMETPDTGVADGGTPDSAAFDAGVPVDSPACAEIARSCVGAEALVVRGHAEGLAGLDGARVEFGVRYVGRESAGGGLAVPRYVARGTTTVRGAAFESCVCVPYNSNGYPEIVGAVFAAGTSGTLGRDVVRAMYSQRYATLGDEDLSANFAAPSTALIGEVAAAALSERFVTVTVRTAAPFPARARTFAGLVATDRPLAPELSRNPPMADGSIALSWFRPGAALAGERVVLVADQNDNNGCDAGDLAVEVPFDGRTALVAGPWLVGADVLPLCTALSVGGMRE